MGQRESGQPGLEGATRSEGDGIGPHPVGAIGLPIPRLLSQVARREHEPEEGRDRESPMVDGAEDRVPEQEVQRAADEVAQRAQ
jgi:hypothetical protein